ncbi:MAG: metallophosphoesterase family protein [Planctomycetales bacterium]|nr:metallophosphoesterase family protein [Planctomycetales bacterium]
MSPFSRRTFLSSSLGGVAATALTGYSVFGDAPPAAKGPESLFLTWRTDPTTTMTIQWVGPEVAAESSIRFALATDKENASKWQTEKPQLRPFPNTDLKVHCCELMGLAPGTEYKFQIGEMPALHRFRTMPAKATEVIQFVSGGDCGANSHAIGTNIIAAKQEPQFALIGGDLAYDNGKSPETFLAFLRNYSQHMVDQQGRLIPMISCIGNHEVDGGYKGTREKSPQYLSVFDGLFAERTYGVLDIGDYLSLVLLDTGHIAPIGGEQTEWLVKTLAERQERPHLIVAGHVPAYPSYRAPEGKLGSVGTGEENRKFWVPLFEKYKVDVVLEHHDHTFKRTHPLTGGLKDKYGVLYLGDGSWGMLRPPVQPEKRPYLAAVSQAYHMTVHRLEGEQRFHVALEESGKVADVCMTTGKRPSRRG